MPGFFEDITETCTKAWNDYSNLWSEMLNSKEEVRFRQGFGAVLCGNFTTAPLGLALMIGPSKILELIPTSSAFSSISQFFQDWKTGWEDIFNTEIDFGPRNRR